MANILPRRNESTVVSVRQRWHSWVIVLSLAVCASLFWAIFARPNRPSSIDEEICPNFSIDGVSLGMTSLEVERNLGTPNQVFSSIRDGSAIYAQDINIAYEADRAVSIDGKTLIINKSHTYHRGDSPVLLKQEIGNGVADVNLLIYRYATCELAVTLRGGSIYGFGLYNSKFAQSMSTR